MIKLNNQVIVALSISKGSSRSSFSGEYLSGFFKPMFILSQMKISCFSKRRHCGGIKAFTYLKPRLKLSNINSNVFSESFEVLLQSFDTNVFLSKFGNLQFKAVFLQF